jgi:hypothetical protein
MECADTRRIAAAWENGEELAAEELEEAYAHVLSCDVCRMASPAFLALAHRDRQSPQRPEPSAEGRALADRVMADIGTLPHAAPARIARFPLRRAWPFAAAALAACALFIVGLGWDSRTVEVRFVLDAPNAKSVYLAGDFSSWEPKGLELKKSASGLWERTIRLKRGRSYSYNFLVDGTSWVVDPSAPERIDDGFGGESALIRL